MSAGIAAWIAHVSFWLLLVYGWAWDEIRTRGLVIFLSLWIAGLYAVPYVSSNQVPFSSFVAALDIALVFLIFKGDVRLT